MTTTLMAAIARFGFEGGKVPSNVSVYADAATGSGFRPGQGRGGGTCVEAFNVPEIEIYYGALQNGTSTTEVTTPSANQIYFSCQLKKTQVNFNEPFVMFEFGGISVTYIPASNTFTFQYNSSTVYTSPATVNFPLGNWISVSGRFVLSSSAGEITVNVDGISYSVSPINSGTTPATSLKIHMGCAYGVSAATFTAGYKQHGPPRFQLDDVAVNNNYTATNTSGSFGASDSNIPPFISCQQVNYLATGSNTVGWTVPDGNIIGSIGSTGSGYLTASFLPRPVLELVPSQSVSGITTVEGINYFYSGAFREGSATSYMIPHFMLNDTSSVQGQATFLLQTARSSGTTSVFEKDLGGKITYSEFLNGKIALDSTQWMNKNFFGRGTLGNVRYSTSGNFDSTGSADYVILEYQNLIIDSGVTMTTSVVKKGLIIYVKENCIINGTISMVGKAPNGLSNLPNGFIFSKNVNENEFNETGSILNPNLALQTEQLFQPYSTSPTSSRFDINTNYAGNTQTAASVGGQCGGGGYSNSGTVPGLSSTSYGGGKGGAIGSSTGGDGGGIIYLIVGKNLYLSAAGIISCAGGAGISGGTGAGGGGGGGAITLLYGKNFVFSGAVSVAGGSASGAGAISGGAGSVRISKILSF